MILIASRRTDIPNYHSEWFLNRIKEGFVYVRAPLNIHQISKITISSDVIDCIVFWTKNPEPMLHKLEQLKDYHYYFQYTLTSYGKDIEPNLPEKNEILIPVFKKLSDIIGNERVIWRYDPIMKTDKYSEEYHLQAFQKIASDLEGYTTKVVISFYAKTVKNINAIPIKEQKAEEQIYFAKNLSDIAKKHGMQTEFETM